ncbi:MAG: retropepsin-like aspartic protease [Halioglobus sp.]
MKQLLQSACLLLAGITFGWWLRDSGDKQLAGSIPAETSINQVSAPSPATVAGLPINVETDALQLPGSTTPPNAERFHQLLMQQKFDLALAYYEQALLIDDGYQQLLRPALEGYLQTCLEHCSHEAIIDLVNLWLGAYYQDIPVMLLLAESQRLQGSPEEAASTLQIAATYALQGGQQEEVRSAVQRLVKFTDEALSRQQSWIELLGFYEFLATIDLGTPTFQLRQAQLYQLVDEPQRSHELLVELRNNDNGLSSQWTAALDQQLAKSAIEPSADQLPSHAIPVTRHRDHFLVASSVNRGDQLNLIIDTGASITTLTRDSFSRVVHSGFEYRGSRLFNTANGLTQGEVYRVTSISVGETRIDDLDIAVLDYESSEGVDGLLGMNVLRNFRFEIDQDKELLYLRPRPGSDSQDGYQQSSRIK